MITVKSSAIFSFSLAVLLLSPSSSSSREFLSFVRSGRMASLMTVYLSPDRSCSTSLSSSVLAVQSRPNTQSCRSLCSQTNTCVAFSFRTSLAGQAEAPESKVRPGEVNV